VRVPIVRNESEDFRRDPVDWCDRVPPGPNQAEDLESILFESVEPKYDPRQSQPARSFIHCLTSAWSGAVTILRARLLVLRDNIFHPSQTYFVPNFEPCRMSLTARKCWDTGEPRLAVGEDMTADNVVDRQTHAVCGRSSTWQIQTPPPKERWALEQSYRQSLQSTRYAR